MILKCSCQHEFQDSLYGKGNRLCNPCKKQEHLFRCTVCKKEITVSKGAKDVGKEKEEHGSPTTQKKG